MVLHSPQPGKSDRRHQRGHSGLAGKDLSKPDSRSIAIKYLTADRRDRLRRRSAPGLCRRQCFLSPGTPIPVSGPLGLEGQQHGLSSADDQSRPECGHPLLHGAGKDPLVSSRCVHQGKPGCCRKVGKHQSQWHAGPSDRLRRHDGAGCHSRHVVFHPEGADPFMRFSDIRNSPGLAVIPPFSSRPWVDSTT